MAMTRRRAVAGAFAGSSLVLTHRHAGAVIVLDSTWRAEGGGPGHESAGFEAHIALANQPQFASLVAFSADEGDVWGVGSGTWIGNVDGCGQILTAGHNFDDGGTADQYLYRVGDEVHHGAAVLRHPSYNGIIDERVGFDLAIVTLEEAVTNVDQAPFLSARPVTLGQRIVMVGFGSRGIASVGQRPVYYEGDDMAAAENVVDELPWGGQSFRPGEDAGNWFGVTMRREEEGATPLEGILGSGDSGGSAWSLTGAGWAVVGVNASGTGDTYGAKSYFGAVAGVRQWISAAVPSARFVG